MKPRWYSDITLEKLPEDFQLSARQMAEIIRPLLRKDQEKLADTIALECVKADLAEFEGTDRYYPKFNGDKFCPVRHEAIRTDYYKQRASNQYTPRDFMDKWNITERSLRAVIAKGVDPRQMEAFPDKT